MASMLTRLVADEELYKVLLCKISMCLYFYT
jgi:hypothetical protein